MYKNKSKIFLILIFIIFTSGCSAQYNLSINEDSSINEVIIATERTDRLEARTKLKGEQAVNYLFNMFTKENDRYSLNTKIKDFDTIATVSSTYKDIDEYARTFSNDIFDDVLVSKEGDYITINVNQKVELGGSSPTTPIYDSMDITIEVPFNVIDHNAKYVNGNLYKWEIRKNNGLQNIRITYKNEDIPNEVNIKVNDKKYNFEYWYIVVGIFSLLVISLVMFVLIKNRKNNIV